MSLPEPDTLEPLARRHLPADPVDLAQWLIGKSLVRKRNGGLMSGRIVETEAYLADDPASHSFRGRTDRNKSMFAERGHAYVYRIYGMWFCVNVAAGAADQGAAVLLRALEPLRGIEQMRTRRPDAKPRDLMRGPGRLCAALDINQALDGADLCRSESGLWLTENRQSVGEIGVSARIGLTRAVDQQLRFYERGNIYVSGPARMRG